MPDWDAKPPAERDVYGTEVTQMETVDARPEAEIVDEQIEEGAKPLGLWSDTWRRLKRNKLALIGLAIIVVFITSVRSRKIAFMAGAPSHAVSPRCGQLRALAAGPWVAAVSETSVRHRLSGP